MLNLGRLVAGHVEVPSTGSFAVVDVLSAVDRALDEAQVKVQRLVYDMFGPTAVVTVKSEFDSDRDPSAYRVAEGELAIESASEVIDAEFELVEAFLDQASALAQDRIVIVCRRR